jgi:PIN domain nuclease of toxin-antitoxin system
MRCGANVSLEESRESGNSLLRNAMDDLGIRILPYSADHAFRMFELPRLHNDPFDRQIMAQALCEGIPVITLDEKFGLYEGIKVVW